MSMRRELWKLTPLLLPASLLAAGLGHTLRTSLQPGAWEIAVSQPELLRNLLFSLYVAGTATLISVLLGSALAYLVRRLPQVYTGRSLAFLVPLVLPHIAVGFLVLLWFSQSGLLAAAFAQVGLEGSFRSPLFHGDGAGIIIGYVFKSTPFVLLLMLPVIRHIPEGYIQTARMLGAGEFRTFWRVVFPRLRPGMLASAVIVFVYSFGAYDLPLIVGESRPRMISLYLYRLYFTRPVDERPIAAALLVLVFLLSTALVVAYARVVRGVEERERRL